jgi:hypothetical protein
MRQSDIMASEFYQLWWINRSCKWTALLLFRFGDWYLENQHNDGHWENTKHWNPKPTLGDNIEMTAEFIIHLSNIMKYISA